MSRMRAIRHSMTNRYTSTATGPTTAATASGIEWVIR
ncbi:Uncharacterised protein [Mycobacteroides abscessus subsp. abscessus]|nr:Uncharacterised protein [Mycobacteroides abscessus subsp. abscessus]SIN46991.1 Uncharacterised protein [Mycobacteroides abscessus subsp. abscessus]SKU11096.1 Uncharacterised protein [Mycobacteroides abscessus subsp. abscessus]